MRAFALVVVAAFVGTVSAVGCGEDYKTCYPGDYLGCTCGNGQPGYAKCSPSGDYANTECVCDGTTPGIDAGVRDAPIDTADSSMGNAWDAGACVLDAGDAVDGGLKKYFEPCTSSSECESCLCENFGDTASCTLPCTTLDQCPAPAMACTNRGLCRPPL